MHKLPTELLEQISMYDPDPITYYNLIQVSKLFKLDTDIMKARFIKHTVKYGVKYTKLPNGWLHSCNDHPAKMWADGTQIWYVDGKLHRDNDQPTIIRANGYQHWYINGERHRDNNQPAIICANGDRYWFINGKLQHDTNPTN